MVRIKKDSYCYKASPLLGSAQLPLLPLHTRVIFSYITSPTTDRMLLVELYEAAEDAPPLALPLYESLVPAGFPSPADDYIDLKFDVNHYLVRKPCATYFAKISGDSMTGAGIFDGDIIVVDRSLQPSDGKIVVVALDGEFTVKRIRYKGSEVILYPENDKYQPIKIDRQQFDCWGVVTGMVRKL